MNDKDSREAMQDAATLMRTRAQSMVAIGYLAYADEMKAMAERLEAALSQPGEVTEGMVATARAAYNQHVLAAKGDIETLKNGAMRAALTAALGAQTGGETDDDAEYNAHMEAQVREVYEWLRKRGLYDPRDYPEDEGPDVCDLLDQHENELCRQIPEDKRTPLQRTMDAIGGQTRGEGATVKESLTVPDGYKLAGWREIPGGCEIYPTRGLAYKLYGLSIEPVYVPEQRKVDTCSR